MLLEQVHERFACWGSFGALNAPQTGLQHACKHLWPARRLPATPLRQLRHSFGAPSSAARPGAGSSQIRFSARSTHACRAIAPMQQQHQELEPC